MLMPYTPLAEVDCECKICLLTLIALSHPGISLLWLLPTMFSRRLVSLRRCCTSYLCHSKRACGTRPSSEPLSRPFILISHPAHVIPREATIPYLKSIR